MHGYIKAKKIQFRTHFVVNICNKSHCFLFTSAKAASITAMIFFHLKFFSHIKAINLHCKAITFCKLSIWNEKCSHNGSNKYQDLDSPETILYSRAGIFTAFYSIHNEAEKDKEHCHGKTDAIHSNVTNNFVT